MLVLTFLPAINWSSLAGVLRLLLEKLSGETIVNFSCAVISALWHPTVAVIRQSTNGYAWMFDRVSDSLSATGNVRHDDTVIQFFTSITGGGDEHTVRQTGQLLLASRKNNNNFSPPPETSDIIIPLTAGRSRTLLSFPAESESVNARELSLRARVLRPLVRLILTDWLNRRRSIDCRTLAPLCQNRVQVGYTRRRRGRTRCQTCWDERWNRRNDPRGTNQNAK